MKARTYLKESYGYSDFQISQIRYALLSIFSELSKILIMGFFFMYINKLHLYLCTSLVLCILRTCTGGVHCKHYLSCLIVSFSILFIGICVLPMIPLIKLLKLILLMLCVVCNYHFAPIVSSYRPIPNGVVVKKSKRQAFIIITAFSIILYIIPENPYMTAGFWIIILQSLQLIVAKMFLRRS